MKLFARAAANSVRLAAILVSLGNSGARADVIRLPRLETVRTMSLPAFQNSFHDMDVWLDEHGVVCARGFSDGPRLWMELPDVARFRFTRASRRVKAFARPGVAPSLLRNAYYRSVLPMALQARGLEVLHSSAVRTSRGVIALCGLSGIGKSTLAYALSLSGHSLWSDDALAYHPGNLTVVALPFQVRLRPDPVRYFAASHGLSREEAAGSRARLSAIFVLTRQESRRTWCRRLSPAQAFPLVLEHAYCFSLSNARRKRAMISTYLHLCGSVPIFALHVRDGLANVPSVVKLVERTIESL